MHPSLFRVIIKDILDFLVVVFFTLLFSYGIYQILPTFTEVPLSLYYFETFLELFFVNEKLFLWLMGLGFGVSLIYFLFCAMLYGTTFGGVVTSLSIVDKKTHAPLNLLQAVVMGFGAFCGVVAIFLGPLYAWWLDRGHLGLSEKMAGVILLKK